VTPFELVAERRDPEVTERGVLERMSRYLEDQALREAPVAVLACLEGRTELGGAAFERYGRLASAAVFTALLGRGVTAGTVPAGARAVTLHASDDLAHEWDLLVIGPHFSAALVARRYRDGSAGPSEHFEYVVTHDRALVVAAARALLHWVHGRSRVGGQAY
jgi:DICT domain-containing protein